MSSSYLPLYKTMILYMLRRSESVLSRAQVMAFILDAGYTDYMTFQETLADLSRQALIKEEHAGTRTYLHLTKTGKETIDEMKESLRPDIMRQIDDYLSENRLSIREEAALKTDYRRLTNGTYEVLLTAREGGQTLYALTMNAPDEASAVSMCDRWKKQSAEIYRALLEKLM